MATDDADVKPTADTPTPEKPVAEKPAAAAKPVAKPAKAAPPPDPRVVAATAKGNELKAALEKAVGAGAVQEVSASKDVPVLVIDKTYWLQAVTFLCNDPGQLYNYVRLFCGTDYPNYIEITLHLFTRQHNAALYVKTRTERDLATVPSLTGLFQGVNWEEREVYDLLGVRFEGHPDLRRIMMWEEWSGHPLRKDYSPFESLGERGGNV